MLNPCSRSRGEVPERSNGAVSKTVVLLAGDRGFESLPLRHKAACPVCGNPQMPEGFSLPRYEIAPAKDRQLQLSPRLF